MNEFAATYKQLNDEQRAAVDHIDGPLLVIAGPGTGKTQLLGARIANILQRTDTPASSILAMTFTENGAREMRDRLVRFIGQDAHGVHISTYHGFGDELIRTHPEYFGEVQSEQPIDELGQLQIVEQIISKLDYADPLKGASYYLRDVVSMIAELKRALLSPDDISIMAEDDISSITKVNQNLPQFSTMPGKKQQVEVFSQVLAVLEQYLPKPANDSRYGSALSLAADQLTSALDAMASYDKGPSPLTIWKNQWMIKNNQNLLVLDGINQASKLASMANIMRQYQQKLSEGRWYDFADMIVRSIKALEENDDLRFTLQEKYLYIVLDEFQDTNAAQLRLVELLTNNPVAEGRPNVMAVGDDDQAIFAFQGAQYSNMLSFFNLYRDTELINLTKNYRSHADILHVAHNLSAQIEERLHHQIGGINKQLEAASDTLPEAAVVERHEFQTPESETAWVASKIKKLIEEQAVEPSQIAVIAPKHKILESIVPHLNHLQIAVNYDKREDILDAPLIKQVLSHLILVKALASGQSAQAAAMWPEVLSADWWQVDPVTIWQLSWQVSSSRGELDWTQALLDDQRTAQIAKFMLEVARQSISQPLEYTFDQLHGQMPVVIDDEDNYSPLKQRLFSQAALAEQPQQTYQYLSQLTVFRDKLREHQHAHSRSLTVDDALEYVEAYRRAEQPLMNTSPYHQSPEAVNLTTVYGAKGLEYEYVFVVHAIDEVWGSSKRSNHNKISLPAQLAPIRHSGASEDEKLRDLFVAITRSKFGLYLTSHSTRYSGRKSKPLVYLDQQATESGQAIAKILPDESNVVQQSDLDQQPTPQSLQTSWQQYHATKVEDTTLRDILQPRLDHYKISPTHLNTFVDLQYGGPQSFVLNTLLRFPSAPNAHGEFGNAIHESLQWLQLKAKSGSAGSLPPLSQLVKHFQSVLESKTLSADERQLLASRGELSLAAVYEQWADRLFGPAAVAEQSFRNQGVTIGQVKLTGDIDLMLVDKQAKKITVVDYKTGNSYRSWKSDLKLLKYRQQLYCYKLLVEKSRDWSGYTVDEGRLLFVEPDEHGEVISLELNFDDKELERIKQLLSSVWQRIMELSLPDTGQYPSNIGGVKQFIEDLINEGN